MSAAENINSLQEATTAPEPPAESTGALSSPPETPEEGNVLENMETLTAIAPGEIVQGKVLAVTEAEVLVDVGLKSEAAIPRSEFSNDGGQVSVAPGDVVDVWIEQCDETAGTATVSHQKAVRRKAWEEIERTFRERKVIRGRVVGRIKGGLTVDVGVRGFLPGSHADTRAHSNLDGLLGQEIVCKIIKLNRKRNNVVVSRKLAMEEEAARRKAELMEHVVEGAELVGRVKNLTDYGAFIDLGGMDGLLHITDLSWGRVRHPSEVVQVGQEIKVKVLKFDREKERVSLGLKQLLPDPWEQVLSTYPVGDRVTGRVVSITDYGAFVELAPGIEGLIHIAEMTWSRRLRHPSKIVHVGDQVAVVLLDVNTAQRRISLSLKQTLPDPWARLGERFKEGSVVEGRVRNLADFGAFVEIEEGVDGLVHLSNLSWNKNIKHPSEVLRKGQRIEAVVLSLDPAHRRLSLGLKQLEPDIWEGFLSKTQVGDIVKGKVSRLTSFGAFVELQKGIEGLCHISEFGEDHDGRRGGRLEVGAELDFRVIRLNRVEKKIGLSLREVSRAAASLETAPPSRPETLSTMAEALSAAGITAASAAPPSPSEQPSAEAGEHAEGSAGLKEES